ncbi:hypothetical protein KJ912_02945, partial [Patescibacteria group bacterium]|nr:hypothetical protein [Patescibacteria group bacterium]
MKTKRIKTLIILSIYLLPGFIACLFAANKIFPQKKYQFNSNDIDNSTIVFSSNDLFSITPFNQFTKTLVDFKNITVKITGPNNPAGGLSNQETSIKKGFTACFYPVKEQTQPPLYQIKQYNKRYYLVTQTQKKLIPTQKILKTYLPHTDPAILPKMSEEQYQKLELAPELAGFLDGALIQFNDSVFVITNGRKMVIASPEALNKLNYSWDNIIPAQTDEARIHSNTPLPLNLDSAHPNGTILKDASTGQIYLVSQGERIQLDPQIARTYYSAITPIQCQDQNQPVKTCSLQNNRCQIKPDQAFKKQNGNSYIFQLPPGVSYKNSRDLKIKVTFTRKISWDNLKNA